MSIHTINLSELLEKILSEQAGASSASSTNIASEERRVELLRKLREFEDDHVEEALVYRARLELVRDLVAAFMKKNVLLPPQLVVALIDSDNAADALKTTDSKRWNEMIIELERNRTSDPCDCESCRQIRATFLEREKSMGRSANGNGD